jgi:molybdenum cofactor synthesis domain-containing protein
LIEMTEVVTAAALVIGDEILSGRTKDRNIGTIADHLTSIGIMLREVRVVADDQDQIVTALNALRAQYDYVFTTGGIGPTHDDITADSVAAAFNVAIDFDPRAVALMKAAYDARGLALTDSRMRMARMPVGASLITNSVSVAPGFLIGNVIVMAGVPSIMESMLKDATQQLRTGSKMNAETIVLSCPESEIASLFRAHQSAFPDVTMGSYPAFNDGKYRTELVLRSCDQARLSDAIQSLRRTLDKAGVLPV